MCNTDNKKKINIDIKKPFIPCGEEKCDANVVVKFENADDIVLTMPIPKKPDENDKFQNKMWETINRFEQESWEYDKNILDSGFKSINNALDGGIKPGFYIISADSNVGKTILISQLATQIANNNSNAYVMDYSLDDAYDDKMARVIACNNKVIINAVKNPKKYEMYPKMLVRRLQGLNYLRNNLDRYIIMDSSTTTDIETIRENIIKAKIDFDSKGIFKTIVVCIDSFHDLTSSANPNLQDKAKYEYLASYCADMAKEFNIPVICTAELKKLNGILRPFPDHIREATKIKYEAKCIMMCYSDVHYKGEGAEIYFERADKPEKQPIFEVHFAKNKLGSFKGRVFFESYPEISRMEEVSAEKSKHFLALIK